MDDKNRSAYEGVINTYIAIDRCDRPVEYSDMYIKKFPDSDRGYVLKAKSYIQRKSSNNMKIYRQKYYELSDYNELLKRN